MHHSTSKFRILLTPLVSDDSPLLFEWINNEELVSFNAHFKPVAWADHLIWFEKVTRNSGEMIFGIRLKEQNRLIGTCQLRGIQQLFSSAVLQIRIGDPEYLSKGYGSEAVSLLLKFGFEELKLNRIELEVFVDNERAVKSYKKNGFVEEGIKRQAGFVQGKRKDIMMMSILKSEFDAL
jgi:RimJ/RimL family protein N-acetyltransferase